MTAVATGLETWKMTRDKIGHRTYHARFGVRTDSVLDGPLTIFSAAGLPSVGTPWAFGGEFDFWAFNSPEATISPKNNGQAGACLEWFVDMQFTTVPITRCQDITIQDPLSEPYRIGGSFVRYTQEQTRDRNNLPIVFSNLEPVIGPLAEFDANRPTVWCEWNQLTLGIETFAPLIDNVNDSTLWGLPKRCVKLSNVSWTRLLYGVCTYYYKLRFEFDIAYQQTTLGGASVGGFDKVYVDRGKYVIRGNWNTATPPKWVPVAGLNINDPNSYIRYKDSAGELCTVDLDGLGNPRDFATKPNPVEFWTEYYKETNLLALGIPSSL